MRKTFQIEFELDIDAGASGVREPSPEEVSNGIKAVMSAYPRLFGRGVDLAGIRPKKRGALEPPL